MPRAFPAVSQHCPGQNRWRRRPWWWPSRPGKPAGPARWAASRPQDPFACACSQRRESSIALHASTDCAAWFYHARRHCAPLARPAGLMTKIASNLQIDSARLWDAIHETAKFGATAKGGVRRLTLGPEDKQVRDWFKKACEAAGLEVQVDALGSMFGLRKGRDMTKPPVGLGSHLDTQPTGGKFDGVLGTLAALEVVRTLNAAGIETEAPLCIVNWTNEEGSRFAPAMMGSAAYVGDFTPENILARKDAEGVTVAQALDSIGYRGADPCGAQKLGAFIELHIEQGPILEAESKTIGVVDHGQGIIWYDGKITGFESHAGSTPMPLRRDALAALSEIVLAVERVARELGPNAVGTVGEAVIANPSRNVIPGGIAFTIDCRSSHAGTMDAL